MVPQRLVQDRCWDQLQCYEVDGAGSLPKVGHCCDDQSRCCWTADITKPFTVKRQYMTWNKSIFHFFLKKYIVAICRKGVECVWTLTTHWRHTNVTSEAGFKLWNWRSSPSFLSLHPYYIVMICEMFIHCPCKHPKNMSLTSGYLCPSSCWFLLWSSKTGGTAHNSFCADV